MEGDGITPSTLPAQRSQVPCPETLEELGAIYNAEYYRHGCGPMAYDRSEPHWARFFGAIAARLIESVKPRRVLDAGCAMGFLVEAFWDRGVEAWGIDISPFAIDHVRRDMRDYCRVGSISKDIEGTFDLITCIEVVEHMREEDAQEAIRLMCASTDTILFSSTPFDLNEPTHFNVRPLMYWLNNFQEHDFVLDLGYDAGFVAPHAMLLRRSASPWPLEVLQTFVNLIRTRVDLAEGHRQLSLKEAQRAENEAQRADSNLNREKAEARIAELERVRADENTRAAAHLQDELTRVRRECESEIRLARAAAFEEISRVNNAEMVRAVERQVVEVRERQTEVQDQIGGIHKALIEAAEKRDAAAQELQNEVLQHLEAIRVKISHLQQDILSVRLLHESMLQSRTWRSLVGAGGVLLRITRPFRAGTD